MEKIYAIAQQLVQRGRGILAADESTPSCNKRFAAVGVPETEEMRRQYRQLLLTTPGIEESLSGVILYDETIRQKTDEGVPFVQVLQDKGIIPGIKVDQGLVDFSAQGGPGEKITQGLNRLAERLQEYYEMGARFTKWRAVVAIGESAGRRIPTQDLLQKNAEILAEYAHVAQHQGFVPIIEPEVLLDGNHTIERAEEVTTNTLQTVFAVCKKQEVDLKGLILKSSMVLAGNNCPEQATTQKVAEATLRTFQNSVPQEVAGIVFLSGGQSPQQATENLNEISKQAQAQQVKWPLTFSFSRALQEPVLALWAGNAKNVEHTQQAFLKRLRLNQSALSGTYTTNMEA
jgi:fructose-bisphosphate aldolase, class I